MWEFSTIKLYINLRDKYKGALLYSYRCVIQKLATEALDSLETPSYTRYLYG